MLIRFFIFLVVARFWNSIGFLRPLRQVIYFAPLGAEWAKWAAGFPNDLFSALRAFDYVLMHKSRSLLGE